MKINKKLFIKFTILFVLINCSSNNQFLEIDYSKNANLVTMEQKFYKSSGSGKLIAKERIILFLILILYLQKVHHQSYLEIS